MDIIIDSQKRMEILNLNVETQKHICTYVSTNIFLITILLQFYILVILIFYTDLYY